MAQLVTLSPEGAGDADADPKDGSDGDDVYDSSCGPMSCRPGLAGWQLLE